MNREKINGYGAILRFITPILITIVLFILQMMRQDLIELKSQFSNHLSEHKNIEILLEKRLTSLEILINRIK